jgi:RNA-directed DNA polymerase
MRRIRERLSTEARALRGANAEVVIARLNPIIRGWAPYPTPDRGVQARVRRAGRPRVEAGLQVGQTLPPRQVEALGHRPVLRRVRQVQARQVGVRGPQQRSLPAKIRLDADRPAPDGARNGVGRRPRPGRLLGAAAPPREPPAGPGHPASVTRARRPLPRCGSLLLHADHQPQDPHEWEQWFKVVRHAIRNTRSSPTPAAAHRTTPPPDAWYTPTAADTNTLTPAAVQHFCPSASPRGLLEPDVVGAARPVLSILCGRSQGRA